MEKGTIVECRPASDIFQDPAHAYTQQLIRALPVVPRSFAASTSK
jgi:ABC-type dipeptide/oligopeptide/nickel transport system ATPase component